MTASELIDKEIASYPDWRGVLMKELRSTISSAHPSLEEAWKWNSPVWQSNGLICSLGAFKGHVKMHFFKGAALKDRHGLFNAGLDAKIMRAIDIGEGGTINLAHLQDLLREAVAYNAG